MSVRSDDVGVTVEDRAGVFEIDAVNQPVAPALVLVPAEGAYAVKQLRNVLLGHRVPSMVLLGRDHERLLRRARC
jgi:hypothetical protein